MLAGEKSLYKEINKAPEIKFPIKVDVALPAHKISLLIQAELGNVALPDGENHKKHHQQYRIDRGNVFMHAKRLVPCLVDCQIQLGDAISARHALELGRSIAAHVWDNTASQLRQVEGLGEVAVRKLAAASITSIDTLLNTEPSRIEVVLGKNPPFGHQLLKKLESFPNLRVSVKETGREVRVGKGATIRMIADIGFLNQVLPLPQVFNKKPFHVCFLAEDSHGSLIEFRRFGPKQLQHGQQVYLNVELTRPTTHVNCYVMCDDVAGTSTYAELELSGISVSVYPVQQAQNASNSDRKMPVVDDQASQCWDEEFDDGGINDKDLLAIGARDNKIEVVEDIDIILESEANKKSKRLKPYEDDDASASTSREPMQLPNGRWTCQHDCNVLDKKCRHKCCKEGVLRPRRRAKADSKAQGEDPGQKKLTEMGSVQTTAKSFQARKSKTEMLAQQKLSETPPAESNNHHHGQRTRDIEEAPRFWPIGSSEQVSNQDKHCKEPAAKRFKFSKDPETDFWGAEPDLDSDFESDHSPINTKTASPKTGNSKGQTVKEDLFQLFDDDGFLDFGLEDGESINDQRHVVEETAQTVGDAGPSMPSVPTQEWAISDDDNLDFLASNVDLGGFNPPLEHVAMSDVLKKSRGLLDDQISIVVQDMNANLDAPSGSMVKKPRDTEADTTKYGKYDADTDMTKEETEAERQERLYEEDQKKKWQGIDRWIYDEYHEYVELV